MYTLYKSNTKYVEYYQTDFKSNINYHVFLLITFTLYENTSLETNVKA